MKPQTEMIEGPEAWERFKNAARAVVSTPKSAAAPNPFGKRAEQKKKPAARKG